MNGKPRDVVVWADSRHQRKKQIGGATIGLLFLGLVVACVAMAIEEKSPVPLAAIAIVGIALWGWYMSQKDVNARANASVREGVNPAFIADDFGVGDAAVRIPWRDITRVSVYDLRYNTTGPLSVGLGQELARNWTRSTGTLDGKFEVRVELRTRLGHESALERYQVNPTVPLPKGIYSVNSSGVNFILGPVVPSTWRAGLTREIEAKVRFHGVEFR